ncbi:MAG: OadG family protein [Pseudomonadota bacterium]
MLIEGLRIMVVGMGVVFLILFFLVLAVPISARIIRLLEKPDQTSGRAAKPEAPIAAIIAAALNMFRKK